MKITPGPWEIEVSRDVIDIVGSNNDRVCQFPWINPCEEDNARLVSAAPDLLAALEAILAEEDLIYTGGDYASLEKAGLDTTDNLAAQARAAIKKARGE